VISRWSTKSLLKVTVLIAVSLVAVTACGTMEPNSSFVAIGGGSGGGVSGTGGQNGTGSAGSTGGSGTGGVSAGLNGGSSATGSNGGGGSNGSGGTNGGGGGGSSSGGTNGGGGSNSSGGTNGGGQADFASDTGVTATSITLGNVTGVSGALGPDAFGITLTGLKVWVAQVNASGGINGRKIVLDACDDGQDAGQNLTCTQGLIPKVLAFAANNSLSSAGSAQFEYKAGVPDIGFPLNNGYYKYPNQFSLYGTDYPRDGKQTGIDNELWQGPGIFRWFAEQRGIKRAAYFYYSETSSQQEGVAEEQDSAPWGIKDVYNGGGSSGENLAAPNFDSDVIAMKGMGANAPQAVFDAMDVTGNQKLCESMDRFGFTVVAKVSTIEVWDQSIGTPAWSVPCRDSIYVGTTSLSYADTTNPLVAKYVASFNKYESGALQSEWTFQGYMNGQMVGDAISSMGADVTRKGMMSWLDNLPPLDSPNVYTIDGLSDSLSFRVDNPHTPRADCFIIAQWQDSAGTFVTRAPDTTCYQDALIGSTVVPDGS
jgi:branched-chain amino acid transport system substrate-binding protein